MSLRSRIATLGKAVLRANDLDRQVNEELEFHIESYAHDLMRSGLPRDEAFRRGTRRVGQPRGAQRELPRSMGHTVSGRVLQ